MAFEGILHLPEDEGGESAYNLHISEGDEVPYEFKVEGVRRLDVLTSPSGKEDFDKMLIRKIYDQRMVLTYLEGSTEQSIILDFPNNIADKSGFDQFAIQSVPKKVIIAKSTPYTNSQAEYLHDNNGRLHHVRGAIDYPIINLSNFPEDISRAIEIGRDPDIELPISRERIPGARQRIVYELVNDPDSAIIIKDAGMGEDTGISAQIVRKRVGDCYSVGISLHKDGDVFLENDPHMIPRFVERDFVQDILDDLAVNSLGDYGLNWVRLLNEGEMTIRY